MLVVRHTATDDSQKDIYPFVFDDMKKQRQLSEDGRRAAREIGAAIKALGIPIGQVYASKLNRAVETGSLMFGIEVCYAERADRQRRRECGGDGEPHRR